MRFRHPTIENLFGNLNGQLMKDERLSNLLNKSRGSFRQQCFYENFFNLPLSFDFLDGLLESFGYHRNNLLLLIE